MAKPIYFTDIDGTLLNLYGEAGSAGILREMFKDFHPRLKIGPPRHYDFEEAYGISHGTWLRLLDELWDIPVPLYNGAVKFVKGLKDYGFKVLGITLRPTTDAKIAAYRDTSFLGLDGLHIVNDLTEKTPIITRVSEGAECFYLDDNIKTAIDVSIKCLNTRVQLIDRPWNNSLDLCMEYDRVYTFDAAADGARFIHGRHWGKEDFRFRSDPRHSKRED